jgi:hypothetical protein
MPKEIFELLRNVRVRGERLRIALADGFKETEPSAAAVRPKAPRAKKDKQRARKQKDKGKRAKA